MKWASGSTEKQKTPTLCREPNVVTLRKTFKRWFSFQTFLFCCFFGVPYPFFKIQGGVLMRQTLCVIITLVLERLLGIQY